MTVSAILSDKGGDVITLGPAATLDEIIKTLATHRIGAVLIVSGDDIQGIVSERDVVRLVSAGGAEALSSPATSCMTRNLVTCSKNDTISAVMEKMTTGRFRHVPVVEAGKLEGVISIGDVVKYRIAEAEREAEEMRSYISTT
ncbi:MAG TPA: CBS domain-containing protein [Devosia sp.]|nr:CBS domain-containing protein [Devosia sp.]